MEYLEGFLWAQLGSNQRPPDYESYFFAFRCFPIFGNSIHIVDYQHLSISAVFGTLPLSAIVVYPFVYPAKIFLPEFETNGFAASTIGKSIKIYHYD